MVSPKAASWSTLTETYLVGRQRRGELQPQTVRNYRTILVGFGAVIRRPPLDIRRKDIETWMESLGAMAPRTRRLHFSTVRAFFTWMIREGYVVRHPMADLKAPRPPRGVPRAVPPSHVGKVLAVCPDLRARLVVVLMVQMGLRCSEVAGLQRSEIDHFDGSIRITGKGGHVRIVPIPAEATEVLNAYIAEYPGLGGCLIRSTSDPLAGVQAATVSGWVSRWMRDAGIKSRPRDGISGHALRHTALTDMLRHGAHIRDVQQIAGHAHLATTEIYMPLVVRTLAEAIEGRRYGSGDVHPHQGAQPPVEPAALMAEAETDRNLRDRLVSRQQLPGVDLKRSGDHLVPVAVDQQDRGHLGQVG